MNVLKLALVVTALVGIAILSGCQEGYSQEKGLRSTNKVAYQPTGTGFWRPSEYPN
jgi:hypothetical protein